MVRYMYDAVEVKNIPKGSRMVAGYVDGRYRNIEEMRREFPPPRVITVEIAVSHRSVAQVLDVENGDATPEEAVLWCTETMKTTSNGKLTVYCNKSTWSSVREAFERQRVSEPNYWIADYDGVDRIPNGAIAKQYESNNYWDKSVVADVWPGVDHH